MKRYQNYIFDLDGTLLDTLADLACSTNFALRLHDMPEHSIDHIRMFVGNGVRRLIERAVPQNTPKELTELVLDDFRKHYVEHSMDCTKPYEGIMDMLRQLRGRGARTAVVSNKFYAATADLCRHFFGDLREVAIGENEAKGIRKKPSPDTVLEAMRQLHAQVDDTVYVGDSDVDIETAKNSGIPCISVLWGFRDKGFLQCHGATDFVSSPDEIIAF